MKEPLVVLKEYWGYKRFRPLQKDIIDSVLAGKDTLALLPTGGGKSLTYQVPALCKEGITIVVSPLIALMNDQVEHLRSLNIKAVALHSGLSAREIDFTLDNCIYGDIRLLYCSPERLQTPLFQERVQQMNVQLLAVDEAHCISQWGHDFRPTYLKIPELRKLLPTVPILAVTATATSQVRSEIVSLLEFDNGNIFQKSFKRDNLSLSVRWSEDKEAKLVQILKRVPGSAIVYGKTRRNVRMLAEILTRQGINCHFYHAGVQVEERQKRQEEWLGGKVRVMVATNAFGMGIDKSDVRTVVHMAPPSSLEAYYQEAGRAGRDGNKSYAVLLVDKNDKNKLIEDHNNSHPDKATLRHVYQCLANYFQLAIGSGEGVSYQIDLQDFSTRYNLEYLQVFNSLKRLSEEGAIKYDESIFEPSRMRILASHEDLYRFQVANAAYDPIIKTVLRLYGGNLYNEYVRISEQKVAEFLKLSFEKVKQQLLKLDEMELISYAPKMEGAKLTFLMPRYKADTLPLDLERLERLKRVDLEKVESVIGYFENDSHCRMADLLAYFGETETAECGICDLCLERKHQTTDKELVERIKELLSEADMRTTVLVEKFAEHQHSQVLEAIRFLLESEQLSSDVEGNLSLNNR